MHIIFLSDALPVDPHMRPLSDMVNMTDITGLDSMVSLEFVRETSAKAQGIARAGTKPTFYLVMPESVLQHWHQLEKTYEGARRSSKQRMRELLNIDHPEWKKLNIALPESLLFFCLLVRVQGSNFVVDFLNRIDSPVTGKKIYRPPVYNDEVHGA